jgi:hypothetical protein
MPLCSVLPQPVYCMFPSPLKRREKGMVSSLEITASLVFSLRWNDSLQYTPSLSLSIFLIHTLIVYLSHSYINCLPFSFIHLSDNIDLSNSSYSKISKAFVLVILYGCRYKMYIQVYYIILFIYYILIVKTAKYMIRPSIFAN